ncbi:hypothetical protein SK128_022263 [Halocaridina rubra]|uniref:CUB domain-containing protein n=1 Tax=Halocaridina rubra TaxID=373956 RepID=A0AAN8WZF1_HALRR
MSCQKQKQPQAAPLLVVRFICLSLCHLYIVSAAVAPKDDRTDHLQGNWSSPLQQIKKYDDILDEDPKSEILRREKRRVDLPDLEMNGADDDPYTIVEESDECFWCDSDTPEDDDEHRAAVIYRNTITVSPGECVINKSPRWPGRYPNNVDYRWTYQTVDGSMLTFTVPVGGLQISKGCHRDKLNVRVGRTTVKKCGQFYNFVITSKSLSSMYIRFASNHRIRWHGYRGTVCASSLPTTTTTPAHTTTTSTPGTTTTTTPPPPIYCGNQHKESSMTWLRSL